MHNIALLVSENYDESIARSEGKFVDEHALLKPIFEDLGARFERVTWTDPSVNYTSFDCIIPKAVWDYYEVPDQFRTFLIQSKEKNLPWINPIDVVLWNMDKSYLADIEKLGLPVTPSILIQRGQTYRPEDFEKWNGQIIVKPSISGGSRRTVRIHSKDWEKHKTLFDETLQDSHLLIQPFIEGVSKEGEYSFFFFGKDFSHAVLKKPKDGDYRAHAFFGSQNINYQPKANELKEVAQFLRACPKPCAYNRIDLIRDEGKFILVELELIEPYLYFESAPDSKKAAQLFARAIIDSI